MNRVKDKVAIVTGAARGIGKACAYLLAQEGAIVYLTDIDQDLGATTAGEICKEGGRAKYFHLDIRREEDWARVTQRILEKDKQIDILINNAGLYFIEPLEQNTMECARKIFETNVFGTLLGMKHLAPIMAKNGGGSVVNLSSMDAFVGAEGFAIYGGSKGAITTMTRDAAIEYAKKKVRFNSVHPGYIRTRMAAYGAKKDDKSIDELGEEFPMGHIGEPEDVAWGVLYLASDESRWVTGTQLRIDGGVTAS